MEVRTRQRAVTTLRVTAAWLFVAAFVFFAGVAVYMFRATDGEGLGVALAVWGGFFASLWGLIPALLLLGVAEVLDRRADD